MYIYIYICVCACGRLSVFSYKCCRFLSIASDKQTPTWPARDLSMCAYIIARGQHYSHHIPCAQTVSENKPGAQASKATRKQAMKTADKQTSKHANKQ